MQNVSKYLKSFLTKKRVGFVCILIFSALAILSCEKAGNDKKVVIGFSQCFSNDEWRKAMNEEIMTEITLTQNENVQLIFKNADGNTSLQQKQIEELMRQGIDVLLVSPNEAQPLTDVISKAYKKGIPVVVIDRNISNKNFSAFVGGNNLRVGEIVAEMVNENFKGKQNIKILQITGLHLSSPAEQRKKGFESALDKNLNFTIKDIDGNWHHSVALKKLDSLYKKQSDFDVIFAHNDEMAYAAHLIAKKYGKNPQIFGVDGLLIPNGGLAMVRKNLINGTVSYPPGGDKAFQLALDILNKKKVDKYNYLNVFPINKSNVETIYSERQRIDENHGKLKRVMSLYDSLTEILKSKNRFLFWISALCILIFFAFVFILFTLMKIRKKNEELKFRQDVIDGQYNKIFLQRNELVEVVKKMEELKELQSNYFMDSSHELKNLLTLIRLDLDEMEKTGKIRRHLKGNIRKLSLFTQKILNYKNIADIGNHDILDFKYGNLSVLVNKIINNNKLAFDLKNITVETNIQNTYCDFSEAAIESILVNLLSNAQKYTPENGFVEISLQMKEARVVLSVKDNGAGISKSRIDEIFKRYYKAEDDDVESFGIGLNVAMDYAQKHSGNIQIDSKKGEGSEFRFVFPARQNDEQKIIEENSEKSDKILIVEDDDSVRKRLKEILRNDYKIIEAANGKDGFEKAKYESPKLIISDILMPGTDGFEMIKMLSGNPKTKFIPIIILSAVEEKDMVITAYDLGIDSYVQKPFDKDKLLAMVNNVLQKRKDIGDAGFSDTKDALSEEDKEFLNNVKSILYENILDRDFLLEDIAKQMGMSRSKFYRKIKDITNESPVHLIRNYKLDYAAQIILKKDLSVSETAYESGFSDVKYFSRYFFQKFNIYPSQYKKEYK